jgi:hypothetical protein
MERDAKRVAAWWCQQMVEASDGGKGSRDRRARWDGRRSGDIERGRQETQRVWGGDRRLGEEE